MKVYRVEAVVLKTRNMREADQIVTMFSREYGKIRAVAHGVSRPTSRKRGAVQPFCLSRFLLNRGREIDTVSQCEEKDFFPHLRNGLETIGRATYLAELVDGLTVEGEANEPLFRLLLEVLELLGKSDGEFLTRAFETKLVAILGYRPRFEEECLTCGSHPEGNKLNFHYPSGGVLCPKCSVGKSHLANLSRGALRVLELFQRRDLQSLDRLKIGSSMMNEIRELLRSFIEYHLDYKLKPARIWTGL